MRNTIQSLVIGLLILALVWFVFLPLLTGTVHSIAVIVIVVVVILWLLSLGGIIS